MIDVSDQTVELYCGKQKTFSMMAGALGFKTFTVDRDPNCNPNLVSDLHSINTARLPVDPLIVWASPPDEGFAPEHWSGTNPRDDAGTMAIATMQVGIAAINAMDPKWWFIESPKGLLRSLPTFAGFNRGYPTRNRRTIRHDEYGGNSPRETDVWTNAYWWIPRPEVANAEGGVDTGRRVPPKVFAEIFAQLELFQTTGIYGQR
jgi:hypothetical protein